MKQLDPQISEDIAPEVFALASRLYAERSQTYSLSELMQAGAEAQIPPESMQQAVAQIQAKRIRTQVWQKRLVVILAGTGAAILLWGVWTYNALSGAAQRVDVAWAQVENQLQRRADLIPNLVSVTQAYAQHERDLVIQLTHSRQSYLRADNRATKIAAMQQMSQAIDQFQAYLVRSPKLQSAQLFNNLQYELAGTENRLAVERMRYNQTVYTYNQKIQLFPDSLLTSILGFNPKPYLSSQKH